MSLKKLEQNLKHLESKLAFEKLKQRKTETRVKIELGGLIIKSGLNSLPKNVLLGILCDAREKLENKEQSLEYYQALGNIEFSK